jgi:CheY-like chemotaxis protein
MNPEKDVLDVRNSICDIKDLLLFKAVSTDKHNNRELLAIKASLSKKQYYSRLSKFIKTSLIEGNRGHYSLTSIGVLVRESLKIFELALYNETRLKSIDKAAESPAERMKLIEALVDDQMLKSLMIQGYCHLEGNNVAKKRDFYNKKMVHSKNIILIEADRDTLLALTTILNKNGFNVKGFVDPYEALNHFVKAGNNYDLVICDMHLPRLNGFELCQKMNRIEENLKVIIVTHLQGIDEIASIIKRDINLIGILEKPIVEADLIVSIHNSEVPKS